MCDGNNSGHYWQQQWMQQKITYLSLLSASLSSFPAFCFQSFMRLIACRYKPASKSNHCSLHSNPPECFLLTTSIKILQSPHTGNLNWSFWRGWLKMSRCLDAPSCIMYKSTYSSCLHLILTCVSGGPITSGPLRHIVISSLKPLADVVWNAFDQISSVV